jgi:hypothetical protein
MLKSADVDAVLPPGYGYGSETCFLVQASKMIWGGWMLVLVFEFGSLYNFIFLFPTVHDSRLMPLYSRLYFIDVPSTLSMYVMMYPPAAFSLTTSIRPRRWHVPARMGRISRWYVTSQLIHEGTFSYHYGRPTVLRLPHGYDYTCLLST